MAVYDTGLYDSTSLYDVAPPVTGSTVAVPGPTLADVLAQASHVAVARLSVLWPDGTVRRTFDLNERIVLNGTVVAERRRDVRRSATLILRNWDGALTPAITGDLFAEGSAARIERGALVAGQPVYVVLIEGYVTLCTVSMRGTIDLTIEGYTSALAQDAGTALVLPAGTPLPDALHTLWDPVLPTVTWLVDFESGERALGADIPVLPTDSRLDVGLQLARILGCEPFDDRAGRIVVRVRPDPQAQTVARVMTEPLDLTRTVGRKSVNAQGVEASPGESEPFYVLEEVTDQASPIHRDHIGLRVAPTIRSDAIPDPATARATARLWLAGRAMSQDQLSVVNLPIHLDLDEGDVVERVEARSGTSGRWLIEGISYPVGPGSIDTTESQVAPSFLEDA